MIDASRIREDEADSEAQSGHETMMQSERVGVIVPNYTDRVYFSKNLCPFIFQWIVQNMNPRKTRDKHKEVVS